MAKSVLWQTVGKQVHKVEVAKGEALAVPPIQTGEDGVCSRRFLELMRQIHNQHLTAINSVEDMETVLLTTLKSMGYTINLPEYKD